MELFINNYKIRKGYIVGILVLILFSCDISSDCMPCVSPPPHFVFEFIDNTTGESVFENDRYSVDNLNVTDDTGAIVPFEVHSYKGRTIIELTDVGWELDPKVYTIELSQEFSINIRIDMDEASDGCCSYFKINLFQIPGYEYVRESSTGIYIYVIEI